MTVMKRVIGSVPVILALLGALPVWAETPSFDPDQPFHQAFSSQMLRTWVNQALDVLEDHVQISGDLSNSGGRGDQQGRFELKLYPKGKSQSHDHVKAEGWFHVSPEAGRQDFHLRFERPENSRRPLPEPEPIM